MGKLPTPFCSGVILTSQGGPTMSDSSTAKMNDSPYSFATERDFSKQLQEHRSCAAQVLISSQLLLRHPPFPSSFPLQYSFKVLQK